MNAVDPNEGTGRTIIMSRQSSICAHSPLCQGGVGLFSAVLIVLMSWNVLPYAYGDPAHHLLALQQYLQGEAPSPLHMVLADPNALNRDLPQWLATWPPGPAAIVWPWMAMGFSIGEAVFTSSALLLLLGGAGWGAWVAQFRLGAWTALVLAALIPWVRYASNTLFGFSAEGMMFGFSPWLLLLGVALDRHWHQTGASRWRGYWLSVMLGLGIGLLYIMKYTGLFLAGAVWAFLAARVLGPWLMARWRTAWLPGWRALGVRLAGGDDAHPLNREALLQFAVVTLFFLLPVLTWSITNYHYSGSANSLDQHASLNELRPLSEIALMFFSFPGLALAGFGDLISYLLFHPTHGLLTDLTWYYLMGIPGTLAFYVVIFHKPAQDTPSTMAWLLFLTTLSALLLVWFITPGGFHVVRYFSIVGFATLPLVARYGEWMIKEGFQPWRKRLLLMLGLGYIVLPMFYGVATVVGKAQRFPDTYRAGPSGLYNSYISTGDAAHVLDQLLHHCNAAPRLWLVSNHIMKLDLPGRALSIPMDWLTHEQLKTYHPRSEEPLTICAMIAEKLEHNGKWEIVRHRISQTGPWRRIELEKSHAALWISTLRISP